MASEKIRIAVVTGEHGFREREFDAAFASMRDVDVTREELAEFICDPSRTEYAAVVFYNFHQPKPDPTTADAILDLTRKGQGIVVLHHAILAFLEWDEWAQLVGVQDRKFGYTPGQKITVHVAEPNHPIVAGVPDWEMTEETYQMNSPDDALLTVDHPTSMKGVAWARTYRNSRVFCFQCGHDDRAYTHPQFREVLHRAILWTAGRL
jgi:type 1 glutamine amidotransferase